MVAYDETGRTVYLRFSMPTAPLYPSITLYPSLTLYPGDDSLPLPDTFAGLETDTIALILTPSETDTQTIYDALKSISIISDVAHYETAYLSDVYIYIIPIPTITVSETDYQTFNEPRTITQILTPSETDNTAYTDSRQIDILSAISVSDLIAYLESNKSISISSDISHIDNISGLDTDTVPMIMEFIRNIHVPYNINTKVSILQPKLKVVAIGNPKIKITNL